MKLAAKIRSWTIGAAVGVLIALLVIPTARGLFYMQLSLLGMTSHRISLSLPQNDVALRYPNDFQIQVAAAHSVCQSASGSDNLLDGSDMGIKLEPARDFEARFSDNPSTYANILRWMSTADMDKSRPETYLEGGSTKPENAPAPLSKEYCEFFDDAATKGEKLDPYNAYFPMMRSAELFDMGKDAEAMSELHRAAQDTQWQEYYQDEVSGLWKESDIALGFNCGLIHLSDSAAIIFPQYSLLRASTRIALYKAMLAERSGDYDRGIAIRADLLRCGSLMRSHSQSLIGALVGSAFATMSSGNSGGTVKRYRVNGQSIAQSIAHQVSDYSAYLIRHGYHNLGPATKQEFDNSANLKQMISASGIQDLEMKLATQNGISLIINIALLASASIFIMTAFLSLMIQKFGLIDGLSPNLRNGIAAVACLLMLAAAYGTNNLLQSVSGNTGPGLMPSDDLPSNEQIFETCVQVTAGFCIVIALALAVVQQLRKGKLGIALLINFLKVLAVVAAVVAVLNCVLYEVSCCVAISNTSGSEQPPFLFIIGVLVVLGPTIVVIAISMVNALLSRRPIVSEALSGLTRSVAPVASVMVLIYGCVFVVAVHTNAKVDVLAKHSFVDEATFYASAAHMPWPGPIGAVNLLVKDSAKTSNGEN